MTSVTYLSILTVLGLTEPDTSIVKKQSVRGTSRGLVKLNVASPSWPTLSSGNWEKSNHRQRWLNIPLQIFLFLMTYKIRIINPIYFWRLYLSTPIIDFLRILIHRNRPYCESAKSCWFLSTFYVCIHHRMQCLCARLSLSNECN